MSTALSGLLPDCAMPLSPHTAGNLRTVLSTQSGQSKRQMPDAMVIILYNVNCAGTTFVGLAIHLTSTMIARRLAFNGNVLLEASLFFATHSTPDRCFRTLRRIR